LRLGGSLQAIACLACATLETGEVATIRDIAVAEKVSERFVSSTMRLAYLSPIVLEKLVKAAGHAGSRSWTSAP
jgi:hypothetical protein